MKNTTFKKSYVLVVVVAAFVLLAAALFYKSNPDILEETKAIEPTVTDTTDTSTAGKSPTLSPKGKPVVIKLNRCDTTNYNLCFGSGAKNLGEIKNSTVWEMISTSNKLYFGIVPSEKDARPYIVEIDFKNNVYDASEYEYYKNKSPELF